MAIATVNPSTGETVKVFEALTDEAIDSKLTLAQQAFEQHRHTSFAQRAEWLHQAAQLLVDEKEHFGKIMTLEMGKPIAAAIAEVEKSASLVAPPAPRRSAAGCYRPGFAPAS
ncbi:aldehyde dehydrogenase family protein [Leptolyngbya sp. 7M]|uniref:aldehyde dehydrogenase family protein n=1 Tax=Leptolyngbya sp. 7M TaxID=2812896 RepID=UPI0021F0FF91|nr:aldehyde dehydrogenase family protein [Leptolyngbya sp. 7M]